jgi:hypothetical protein
MKMSAASSANVISVDVNYASVGSDPLLGTILQSTIFPTSTSVGTNMNINMNFVVTVAADGITRMFYPLLRFSVAGITMTTGFYSLTLFVVAD